MPETVHGINVDFTGQCIGSLHVDERYAYLANTIGGTLYRVELTMLRGE